IALIRESVTRIEQTCPLAFLIDAIGRSKLDASSNGTAAGIVPKWVIGKHGHRAVGRFEDRAEGSLETIENQFRIRSAPARRQHVAPTQVDGRRLAAWIAFIHHYRRRVAA